MTLKMRTLYLILLMIWAVVAQNTSSILSTPSTTSSATDAGPSLSLVYPSQCEGDCSDAFNNASITCGVEQKSQDCLCLPRYVYIECLEICARNDSSASVYVNAGVLQQNYSCPKWVRIALQGSTNVIASIQVRIRLIQVERLRVLLRPPALMQSS